MWKSMSLRYKKTLYSNQNIKRVSTIKALANYFLKCNTRNYGLSVCILQTPPIFIEDSIQLDLMELKKQILS